MLPLVGVEAVHPAEQVDETVLLAIRSIRLEVVLPRRKSLRRERSARRRPLDRLELRLLIPCKLIEFLTSEVSGRRSGIVVLLIDLGLLERLGADEFRVGAIRVSEEKIVSGAFRVGHGGLEDVTGGEDDDLVGLWWGKGKRESEGEEKFSAAKHEKRESQGPVEENEGNALRTSRIVLSLCATTTVVRPLLARSRAS